MIGGGNLPAAPPAPPPPAPLPTPEELAKRRRDSNAKRVGRDSLIKDPAINTPDASNPTGLSIPGY